MNLRRVPERDFCPLLQGNMGGSVDEKRQLTTAEPGRCVYENYHIIALVLYTFGTF